LKKIQNVSTEAQEISGTGYKVWVTKTP
jgi:hypothetical protein